MAIWIAILASSIWGVINTLVAGWLVRSRTKSQTTKIQAETKQITTDSEAKIYEYMQEQLASALRRADQAETRANQAINESHKQGDRIMKLIEMFELHIPWDRVIKQKLIELGVSEHEIPSIPELDPYSVLNKGPSRRTRG